MLGRSAVFVVDGIEQRRRFHPRTVTLDTTRGAAMTDQQDPSTTQEPGSRQLPDLTGRVALVTGSSRGMVAATARRLARCGADVVVTHRRNAEAAESVAADVRATGRRAWVHQVDLGDDASVDELFDAVAAEPAQLDLLVLNAAATSFRALLDAERRHLERTFAISVFSSLQCVQRAVPLMGERGGRVVAISGADVRTWIPAQRPPAQRSRRSRRR